MHRIAFTMKVFAGQEAEYRRRHDSIWPELASLLKTTGIEEYSIFLEEETGILFATLRVTEPARLDLLPAQAIMQKWWNYMKDIMESNPDDSPVTRPLKEVFYMP